MLDEDDEKRMRQNEKKTISFGIEIMKMEDRKSISVILTHPMVLCII